MPLAAMERGPDGFDERTFKWARCDQSFTIKIAADPMKSNSAGWLSSELKPPT